MNIVSLRARGRIGYGQAILQPIAIAGTGSARRIGLEPSSTDSAHGHGPMALNLNGNALLRRRPEAKEVWFGARSDAPNGRSRAN